MPNLYKLQNDAKPGELGGPPFIFGSALRVPSGAYPAWGITGPAEALYPLSLTQYQVEFGDTSPSWMETVVEAANKGGIGNRPQMLRDTVGKAAAMLTSQFLKKQHYVNVTDVGCGAGASLSAYLAELEKIDTSYLELVNLTAVDLSGQSLLRAIDSLRQKGFVNGENLRVVHSRDLDMPQHIEPATQDIVINVAGIHAHAYLGAPMAAISQILRDGGYFVSGDWHHGRWLHPSHTYALLDETEPAHFEWKNKGEFMDEFLRTFPNARERVDLSSTDTADARAIEEIGRYWIDGWAKVRLEKIKEGSLRPSDEQIVAEGHRPVEEYVRIGEAYGLEKSDAVVTDGIMNKNPQQVVPGTNLNMLLVLRKR